jgi:Uma2 family endonuclease
MSRAARKEPLTYAQYLAFERASADKHEFAEGEVFAMSGAKRAHNELTVSLRTLLSIALKGKGCRVFSPDIRVRTGDDVGAYPDVSIVSGKPVFTDEAEDELRNPIVLVEVLSDSTERDKLAHYQTIGSLRDVLFVATRSKRIDHYARQNDGSWVRRSAEAGGAIRVESIGVGVAVEEVYGSVLEAAG